MRYLYSLCWLAIIVLTGCTTKYAYYQSPFQANASDYKTIPLQKDSIRSAFYASGSITATGANYQMTDGVYAFTGSLYRSHSSRHIQGFYGLTGTLGNYTVNDIRQGSPDNRGLFSPAYNYNLNDSLINTMAGNKFFGGWGATAGINYCIPYAKSEWRVIGLEASWRQEFGDYLKFRSALPDTAANLISRYRNDLTLGVSTDFERYTRKGSVGYKVALIWFTHKVTEYDKDRIPTDGVSMYLSQTLHITQKRITGFTQWNWGYKAMAFQLGMSYRLGR